MKIEIIDTVTGEHTITDAVEWDEFLAIMQGEVIETIPVCKESNGFFATSKKYFDNLTASYLTNIN